MKIEYKDVGYLEFLYSPFGYKWPFWNYNDFIMMRPSAFNRNWIKRK